MITQRRVFQAKPGMSGAVVTKMKEFQPIFERHGGPPCRYYTDQLSGRTDPVVWEFEQPGEISSGQPHRTLIL